MKNPKNKSISEIVDNGYGYEVDGREFATYDEAYDYLNNGGHDDFDGSSGCNSAPDNEPEF